MEIPSPSFTHTRQYYHEGIIVLFSVHKVSFPTSERLVGSWVAHIIFVKDVSSLGARHRITAWHIW
jgi:hypothetical protein